MLRLKLVFFQFRFKLVSLQFLPESGKYWLHQTGLDQKLFHLHQCLLMGEIFEKSTVKILNQLARFERMIVRSPELLLCL